MKIVGVSLIVLGVLALVFGGFQYNRQKTVLDLGPIQATATEHEQVPISPIVGTIAIVGGLLLLVTPRRRSV